MSAEGEVLSGSAEDLYEHAPCGYLSTRLDGTIVKVNRTFATWIGLAPEDLVGGKRFQDLLGPGARIYHETHYTPLLRMQGSVSEIAVEFVRADGSRLPALVNSLVAFAGPDGEELIRTTVFDASERRRYEQELVQARKDQQEIAIGLQRGLLSDELPDFEGMELAVAYRPGSRGTEVGGDWYDAFGESSDERVARLVVGDVVGRGIQAASEMGQLRSAVRAFAATGMGPGQVLGALDGYSERYEVGQMATLVCAELAPRSGELRYACAGHLPPLVLSPDKKAQFLWEGRSSPLAASSGGGTARDEAAVRLEPHSTLILYTDGLVERRDSNLDAGMESLRAAAAAHESHSPPALAAELIRALHDPKHDDDVCLLVARLRSSMTA